MPGEVQQQQQPQRHQRTPQGPALQQPAQLAQQPAQQPAQSFAERKAAQLQQEREASGEVIGEPITPEDLEFQTPSGDDGISEDGILDDSHEDTAGGEDDQDDLEGSAEDLDDETLSAEDQDQDGDNVDWEKRYKDLQSETQAIRESEGEREREHAESMAQHLQLRFEMEDGRKSVEQTLEFAYNLATGNAQQFRNINWAQVPPDQVQTLQQQAQQAFMWEQQVGGQLQQMKDQFAQEREQLRQREAAIAKTRLRRTIPDWGNETYGAIRDFAASAGMPAQEFNDITSPVVIEALHAYMQMRQGPSTVQKIETKRKAQTPRGRNARRQPRDERGKFARKQVVPNQRGSFADKHKHRLAMERQGR